MMYKLSLKLGIFAKSHCETDAFLHKIGCALSVTQCEQLSMCCAFEVTGTWTYYGNI